MYTHKRFSHSHRPHTTVIGAFSAIVLAVLAGCGQADNNAGDTANQGETQSTESQTTLRIAHTASAAHMPVAVAEEYGFFEDHNIDGQLELLTTVSLAQAANLVGRQFDVAFGTEPGFLNAVKARVDVQIVAGDSLESSDQKNILLMAAKNSGITSLEDLPGKTIAAPSLGGNLNISTQALIKEAGVDLNQIRFVEMETNNMPDALNSGRIDVAEVTAPISVRLRAEGHTPIAWPPGAVGDPIHQALWLADREWAESNPDVVADFVAALDDANKWMASNPDEALEFVIETTNVPEEYQEFMVLQNYDAHYSVEDLQAWASTIESVTGVTDDGLDFSQLIAEGAKP